MQVAQRDEIEAVEDVAADRAGSAHRQGAFRLRGRAADHEGVGEDDRAPRAVVEFAYPVQLCLEAGVVVGDGVLG